VRAYRMRAATRMNAACAGHVRNAEPQAAGGLRFTLYCRPAARAPLPACAPPAGAKQLRSTLTNTLSGTLRPPLQSSPGEPLAPAA